MTLEQYKLCIFTVLVTKKNIKRKVNGEKKKIKIKEVTGKPRQLEMYAV